MNNHILLNIINYRLELSDHLLKPVCKNLDLVTGELSPPLLLNCPFNPNTSLSCCILNSFMIFSNFFFNLTSSLNLSFICSSRPVLIRFCKLPNSADCFALNVFRAVYILMFRLPSHETFYVFSSSIMRCCTLCASA